LYNTKIKSFSDVLCFKRCFNKIHLLTLLPKIISYKSEYNNSKILFMMQGEAMETQSGFYDSANGINKIAYYIYKPEIKPKAVLQISHGMCEYIGRYKKFAKFMTENGFLVCGNDHLGHGNSVSSDKELGYFAKKDGWKFLIDDLHTMTEIIKKDYYSIPYFLFGHSMGSFAARAYITKYGKALNGVIICGTSGGEPIGGLGILLADFISLFKGEKYRSHTINKIAFGAYTRRYKNVRTKSDWLTRDAEVIDKYLKDKNCKFVFTLSAFKDLFLLLDSVSNYHWAKEVPKNLPVFIISGDMDPVGGYGKGTTSVYERLKKAEIKDIELKLYKDCRHELINETNKDEVFNDILNWINKYIKER
jgi:alpha-beta hydrolase superfamily lysophospholipase